MEGPSQASFSTGTGEILGTPAYMAPEQWATSEVTPAADQFSWGVVAFQWLNDVHPRALVPSFPFDGPGALTWSVEVAPAVRALVEKAIALDPRARFADMRSLVTAFRAAISGHPLDAGGVQAPPTGDPTAAPVAHRAATPAATASTLPIGSLFERYEIVGPLGRGGMGDVYRAFDTRLRRTVALKVLRDPSADLGRVLGEARAMAGLVNRHVVTVFDVGEHAGTGYLTMELVEGTPLGGWIGPWNGQLRDKLRWLKEIADALAAVHAAGLLHRDVKPANVIVTTDGTSKLLDFGIAKPHETNSSDGETNVNPTATGFVRGTPGYLAPEQLMGERASVASDQYGWGLVGVELLSGTLPRPGTVTIATLAGGGVPPDLGRILARALSLTPSARYASMVDLLGELERVDLAVGGIGMTSAAPSAFAPTAIAPLSPRPFPRVTRPSSLVGDVLFVVVLFLVAGVSAIAIVRPHWNSLRPRSRDLVVVYYREDAGAKTAPPSNPAPPPPR